MPTCDARYDVVLTDGRCAGYIAGMPRRGEPRMCAVLDYAEERLPDVFGDPGQLVSARYLAGITSSGSRVDECRIGKRGLVRFWVHGKADHHQVMHHSRRYLRWCWIEPDPPIDPLYDDPA